MAESKTIEERKAEIDQLVERMAEHFRQIRELEIEVASKLESAANAHGLVAVQLFSDAVKENARGDSVRAAS